MIYSLRRKFILISTISVFLVLLVIFVILCVMNHMQLNHTMDTLADAIVSNDGVFPRNDKAGRPFPLGGGPLSAPVFSPYGLKRITAFPG